MMINNLEIKERKEELQTFRGFLPEPLRMFINNIQREEFLRSEGIFEEVHQKEIEYRNKQKSSENPAEFMMSELVKWVDENPEFQDFLIDETVEEDQSLFLDDSQHQLPKFDIPLK